ncbi:DUF1858 domain-containing protein [Dysgonomonas sp. Marseille-P4361]|uniref:DUF1858 domain-containing protein n=1 Tax=Dysgonomonas sp. Marseille-P4361 TaxID=2161820 RepID=UPI000D55AC52|nr:DUF1858 domain-containing protein [Dysgonomonas sp. Marseille-P4361]
MDITLETKVADLLKYYPEVETKLLELSPVFSKLKNPVLRRTVARVTSLQQAAGVAGISPAKLIQELRFAAGLSTYNLESKGGDEDDQKEPPAWFDRESIKTIFDVRPIIESGKSPMQEILKLSSGLNRVEILQLITSFKPVPIIDILKQKGFKIWTKEDETFILNLE